MKAMKTKIQRVSDVDKYSENPFLGLDILTIPRRKGIYKLGRSDKLIVDEATGEIENVAAIYAYEEKDTEGFKKIFVAGIRSMMEMSATGTKAFAFLLDCLRINEATIYINIPTMAKSCQWKTTSQCYKGLGELIANQIIAPSKEPNLWFINPKFIFNGDRLLFMKEYRIKSNLDASDPLKKLKGDTSTLKDEPELIQGSLSW